MARDVRFIGVPASCKRATPPAGVRRRRYYGEKVYIIKNGRVLVYLTYDQAQQELARLGAGDFFGEGALLKGRSAKRNAYISALEYSLIYSLHVDNMTEVLQRYPAVMATIANIAKGREEATASMSVRTFGTPESPTKNHSSPKPQRRVRDSRPRCPKPCCWPAHRQVAFPS